MANTGHDWGSWVVIDAAIALTQGGTTEDISAVQTLDKNSACLISIDVDYSDHAKATGGLFVWILRDIDDTVYEVEADGPFGFEMPFTQNGTNRRTIVLSGAQWNKFKILLDWDNSTASSVATIATAIKKADVPVAS